MSNTHQAQAPAPTSATAAPEAAPETDTAPQLYKLLFESDTPEKMAAVLRANPEIAQRLVDAMQKGFGNAFTMKAIELASDTDHSLASRDRSKLQQSETSKAADASAPSPSEKLPYTADGGWNAIEINKRLGQHDKIKGTDNDGDRCSFASALAAKIFDGPVAVAAYFEAVLTRTDLEDGRADREPAQDVLRALIPVFRGKGATYADLSWAQEALYEATLPMGQEGTAGIKKKGGKTYSISDDMPSEEVGESMYSGAELATRARSLAPGQRLMCGWITPTFQHQIMIANQKGKLYLYDSEKQADGGPHLRDLTAETLAPYFVSGRVDLYLLTKLDPATKPTP